MMDKPDSAAPLKPTWPTCEVIVDATELIEIPCGKPTPCAEHPAAAPRQPEGPPSVLQIALKGLEEAHSALHREDVQSLALDPMYSSRVVAGLLAVRAAMAAPKSEPEGPQDLSVRLWALASIWESRQTTPGGVWTRCANELRNAIEEAKRHRAQPAVSGADAPLDALRRALERIAGECGDAADCRTSSHEIARAALAVAPRDRPDAQKLADVLDYFDKLVDVRRRGTGPLNDAALAMLREIEVFIHAVERVRKGDVPGGSDTVLMGATAPLGAPNLMTGKEFLKAMDEVGFEADSPPLGAPNARLDEVPTGPCGHTAKPYFIADTDNYYCSVCKRGMGMDYYLAAKKSAPEKQSPISTSASREALVIDFDVEDDGRWIADVIGHPGVMAYGLNKGEALTAVVRVLCGSLEDHEKPAAASLEVEALCGDIGRHWHCVRPKGHEKSDRPMHVYERCKASGEDCAALKKAGR